MNHKMTNSSNCNNYGYTLVELIIVMAIMAFIGLAVAGFIGTSMNQYKSSGDEIDLQQEAQLAMNQLGDLILASNDVSTNGDDMTITYEKYIYKVTLDTSKNKIYLRKDTIEGDGTVNKGEDALMAEYVKGLSVSVNNNSNSVDVTMDFEVGKKSYRATQNFSIRNTLPTEADEEFKPL